MRYAQLEMISFLFIYISIILTNNNHKLKSNICVIHLDKMEAKTQLWLQNTKEINVVFKVFAEILEAMNQG